MKIFFVFLFTALKLPPIQAHIRRNLIPETQNFVFFRRMSGEQILHKKQNKQTKK